MGINGAFDQLVAGLHNISFLHLDTGAIVDGIAFPFVGVGFVSDNDFLPLFVGGKGYLSADFGKHGFTLGFTSLK